MKPTHKTLLVACCLIFSLWMPVRAQQIEDTFKVSAPKRAKKLNEYSDYVTNIMPVLDKKAAEWKRTRELIEGLDPQDPRRARHEEAYQARRNEFMAELATHASAMITFRDVTAKNERYLDLNKAHKTLAEFRELSKALVGAQATITKHDVDWDGQRVSDTRDPGPVRPFNIGTPENPEGGPVLGHHWVETLPARVDVGRAYSTAVIFTNNLTRERIFVDVELRPTSGDAVVSPRGPQRFWIGPGRSYRQRWMVTVQRAGAESVVELVGDIAGWREALRRPKE